MTVEEPFGLSRGLRAKTDAPHLRPGNKLAWGLAVQPPRMQTEPLR